MTAFAGGVHPAADLFPMMAAEELKDLAADITNRGLLQAIVLDAEGRILDGRNRHAACGIAGVEPRFTTYEGDDPVGYVLAANIARRHMSKGQQAMVVALACLGSKQTVRGTLGSTASAPHASRRPTPSASTPASTSTWSSPAPSHSMTPTRKP
jgi:hypothetical protein